jgi:serine/threonine-protein kinase
MAGVPAQHGLHAVTLAPGARLGPYEIVAPMGAGGMGEVWRARDTRLARDVALKILPAEFARHPERLVRFQREAQSLAALNHPNVAAIYGLEERDGAPLLVLELVEGETLAARLARGPIEPRDVFAIGAQVASALEAAHERGIVHRDLKPGNVMVNAAGAVKVLDFGLAKIEASASSLGDSAEGPTRTLGASPTEAGVILGTAAYMSPEQARGRPVDRRSDVWSFGCLLFECLSGRPAFAGETVSDLVARILEREPDWSALPPATPARLREIVRRCMRKPADERPRDIRDVRLELAELASGPARGGVAGEHSIAVLPFENRSGADDEFFADGVTDEILNALAQVQGLRVAARSSCFAFKGRHEDPRAVGERLGVGAVLEGTLRRSGSRLRVTVQLVNVADGMQLWSERYDRELTDVFAVQDEIAAAIAKRLSVSLGETSGARRGTQNLEAYELMLKGRAHQLRRGRFLWSAIECFEAAIALDPGYAEAMACLSDSWRLLGTFSVAPPHEMFPKARSFAERALSIDGHLAEAWATIADVELMYEWNAARAEAAWKRALELDPRHTRARCERAQWAYVFGSLPLDVAVQQTRVAIAEDPDNSWALGMVSFLLGYANDQHDESMDFADRAIGRDSESIFLLWNRVRSRAWAGQLEEARTIALGALSASGRHAWVMGSLGWLFGKLGEADHACAVHDELAARARYEKFSPGWVAIAAAAGGRADEARKQLALAVEERDPIILHSRQMPYFDALRSDPAYREITHPIWP